MWNSLRVRLTIIFVGLAVGPLLLVGVILAQRSFTVEREQALDLQHQIARRVSTEVAAFLQEVEGDLRVIGGEIRGLEQPDRARQVSLLLGVFNSGPYRNVYEELTLLDDQGQEQIRLSRTEIVSADELGNRSGTDEFEQAKANRQTYFGPVRFDEATGESFMTIAIPLFQPRSVQLSGVLVADLRFKAVGNLIGSLRVGEGQTIYVVDAENRVVAHQDPSIKLGTRFELPEQAGIQTGLDGTDVVLGVDRMQLGEQEFSVVAERPVSEALKQALNTTLTIVVTTVVALVIAVTLGFLVVRRITRPIEALAATAEAIRTGDLSQQAVVTSRDEIGALAQVFNDMTAQLRELISGLGQRVAERTADLERRSIQLEAAAQVAGEAASVLDPQELLSRVVTLVSERFGFYHAGIFLVDDAAEYAVLRAASSEGGQHMLARGHRLRIGHEGIVGYVTGQGEPRIALDVGADAVFFDNPDLPDTRSEIALPLRARGEIIGALDVQSEEPGAFSKEDVAVLQTLADQVAMTISNARLFQQAQESLEAMRRVYGQISRESWSQMLRTRLYKGQRYDPQGILPADGQWREEMKLAAQREETILGKDSSSLTLTMPIKVRDQIIGVLDAHKPAGAGGWTPEQVALMETLTEQLGLALESARLYQDTQRRAARERLTGQVASRMREILDVDSVLKTAVREIGEALQLHDMTIRLEMDGDQFKT
jgi:GAF domain-containing protein/HAMP domain-containing protein